MIKNLQFTLVIALFTLINTNISMALEEPSYEIIRSNADYEIRKYGDRLAVEVEFTNESSGFRYLFNYISGENTTSEEVSMTVPVTQSAKIDMTAPVTQFSKDDKMVMQFYLPSKFSIENAPIPTNKKVSLVTMDGGYYAVLRYSGRVSDKNYMRHLSKLKKFLEKDNIKMIDYGTKAIFDGPFTLPIMRRNEAMIKIKWN